VLTLLGFGLLAILIAVALFLIAAHLLPAGEQIAPAVRDEPLWTLPADHRLDAGEVSDVRLPVALRGYRFAETDLLLDRLADEIRQRDEEIARLRGGPVPAERHHPSPFASAPAPEVAEHVQPPSEDPADADGG